MICYIDGGCDNMLKSGGYCSFKVYDDFDNLSYHEARMAVSAKTSNESEYMALIECLKYLQQFKETNTIYSDSRLLVNQVNGLWKINFDNLLQLKKQVDLYKVSYTLSWIPRETIVKELGH